MQERGTGGVVLRFLKKAEKKRVTSKHLRGCTAYQTSVAWIWIVTEQQEEAVEPKLSEKHAHCSGDTWDCPAPHCTGTALNAVPGTE